MAEVAGVSTELSIPTVSSDGDEKPVVVFANVVSEQEDEESSVGIQIPMTDDDEPVVATIVPPSSPPSAFGVMRQFSTVNAEGEKPSLCLQLALIFGILVVLGITIALPIVEIVYGSIYLGITTSCSFGSFGYNFIPIWLIVNGVVTLITPCFFLSTIKTSNPDDTTPEKPSSFGCAFILILLFTTSWWFTGAIGFWGSKSCGSDIGAPLQPLMNAALIIPIIFNCLFAGGR